MGWSIGLGTASGASSPVRRILKLYATFMQMAERGDVPSALSHQLRSSEASSGGFSRREKELTAICTARLYVQTTFTRQLRRARVMPYQCNSFPDTYQGLGGASQA